VRDADVGARHVALVGAMGSGKSTIGARVAAVLGRELLDNDVLLERATGRSAAALSARDGLEALHRAETSIVLAALETEPPAVIAAAASTITDARVRDALRRRAWVVWLRADLATLAARLPESPDRPFAGTDAARLVAGQAADRDGRFAEVADATFDTGRTDVEEIVKTLVRGFRGAR
jgi:shikimate kinase